LYAAWPTIVGGCEDSKTPVPLALCLNALFRFVMLNAGAFGTSATFTRITVRVFGPYPGRTFGAPTGLRSGAPV